MTLNFYKICAPQKAHLFDGRCDGGVCGGFSAADIVVRSQPEPHDDDDDDGVHNGGMHYVIIIIIIGSNCTFENSL